MKKSTFLELFRPFCWTLYTTIILLALSLVLGWIGQHLEANVPIFSQYADVVTSAANGAAQTGFYISLFLITLVLAELCSRFKDDDWRNTFRSIGQTVRLHRFLRRQDSFVVSGCLKK